MKIAEKRFGGSQVSRVFEAQAPLMLFTLIKSKKLTCLSSDILKLEIEHCFLPERIRLQSLVCLCSGIGISIIPIPGIQTDKNGLKQNKFPLL